MPFTNYSIYVVPFSKLGAGPNSEEVTVATLEDGNCSFKAPFCVTWPHVHNHP
ncbi:hypothetical protein DPMN_038794 [Dreissena polymorpha]|uniref:Fibronectin type-III domain-containing protein n=1 Tax=Dreissena polymorpha TaxID=45954 RepID=A0A9D4MFZ3_DREPO|nr:hypothetical protein DPMN_038794 [Dreissena polymorpha]